MCYRKLHPPPIFPSLMKGTCQTSGMCTYVLFYPPKIPKCNSFTQLSFQKWIIQSDTKSNIHILRFQKYEDILIQQFSGII